MRSIRYFGNGTLKMHIDPNAEYHGSARYENPNNDFTDNAVDAEFEEMN